MFQYYALAVFLGLVIYYLFLKNNDESHEPPGPKPWPILGNLVHVATASNDVTMTMGVLAKKYGEIYSLMLGTKRTVVLTSKEAITTVLSNEASFGRDHSGMFGDRTLNKNLGLVSSEGEMWEKGRAWTFKNLKEFGFGKSHEMEHHIQTCTETLSAQIDAKIGSGTGCPVSVTQLFNPSLFNIIWQMVAGRVSAKDEADIEILVEKGEAFVRSGIFGMGIVNAFPFLRYLFPKMLGYDVQMDLFNTCNDTAKKLFIETESKLKSLPKSTKPSNLMEAFVQKCSSDEKIFSCENFQIVFQDLFLASTETTSSFMECIIMYLITYPDVQQRIYDEIVHVAPNGRLLKFSDRKGMIYTQAFLLEMHRRGRILQNSVPRVALSDFKYKDYVIKKDTAIVIDTRLYYEDKEIWTDPETFRPERFINETGEICNTGSIISFSVGKRNCPGELYANVTSFLLLTTLLQKYKLSVPEGQNKPRLELRPGFALKPYPFQAMFTKRQ